MNNITFIGDVVQREGLTCVGLDVHKNSIQAAILRPRQQQPEVFRVGGDLRSTKRLVKRLKQLGDVAVCYEAGPTGYGLQRRLLAEGLACFVIAPSLIPRKPGERVKTDRRDAVKLAQYLRTGILTEVHAPEPADEAVRDLCRARSTARADVKRCKHRLQKFLLRRDRRFSGKSQWTQAHRTWLAQQHFEDPVSEFVLQDLRGDLARCEERLRKLEEQISILAFTEPYAERVGWLRCLRGVDTVTAFSLVVELHTFERFRTAPQLMAYLGVTPSEYSTGDSKRQGAITKAGNSHVRKLLIEAAWHASKPPRVGARLQRRREGQPEWVVTIADKAMSRLYRRFRRLELGGKPRNKAVVACARELVGFIWDILRQAPSRTMQPEAAA